MAGKSKTPGRKKASAKDPEVKASVKIEVDPPSSSSAALEAYQELERLRAEEEERLHQEHQDRIAFYRAQRKRDTLAKRKAHTVLTEDLKDEYLAALERTGLYIAAADAVGIHHDTALEHRKKDPGFQRACDLAIERYRKWLIAAAERRAVHGIDEPVFQQGAYVGSKRVYSDRMLELLLKAKAPEFKDKVAVEQSGHVSTSNTNVNVNASTSVAKLEKMTPEQRQALRLVLGVPIGASARPSDERRPGDAPDDLATLGLERHTVDDGGDDGEGN